MRHEKKKSLVIVGCLLSIALIQCNPSSSNKSLSQEIDAILTEVDAAHHAHSAVPIKTEPSAVDPAKKAAQDRALRSAREQIVLAKNEIGNLEKTVSGLEGQGRPSGSTQSVRVAQAATRAYPEPERYRIVENAPRPVPRESAAAVAAEAQSREIKTDEHGDHAAGHGYVEKFDEEFYGGKSYNIILGYGIRQDLGFSAQLEKQIVSMQKGHMHTGVGGPADPSEYTFGYAGYIKADTFFDTRQVLGFRDEHMILFPLPIDLDFSGLDINDKAQFNMTAIQSDFTAIIGGPQVLGAKLRGCLEGNFWGAWLIDNITNQQIGEQSVIGGFYLEQAFLQLDWQDVTLIAGQAWHPMVPHESASYETVVYTVVPFEPFARAPQLRVVYRIANRVDFTFAACSQMDFRSNGPSGFSSVYIRNAVIPNLHAQFRMYFDDHIFGVGLDFKRLVPTIQSQSVMLPTVQLLKSNLTQVLDANNMPVSATILTTLQTPQVQFIGALPPEVKPSSSFLDQLFSPTGMPVVVSSFDGIVSPDNNSNNVYVLDPPTPAINTFKTNSYVDAFSAIVYARIYKDPLEVKLKFTYGSNLTDQTMIGGYGLTDLDVNTGATCYKPLRNLSFLVDLVWRTKLEPGLFIGYTKNIGSTSKLFNLATIPGLAGRDVEFLTPGLNGALYEIFGRGGGTVPASLNTIDHILCISPRLKWYAKPVCFGAEVRFLHAASGPVESSGKISCDCVETVDNVRFIAAIYYYF